MTQDVKHDIHPVTAASPYSIDEPGTASKPVSRRCFVEPPEDAFLWTVDPRRAPDEPAYVEIEFKRGIPIAPMAMS